MRAVYVYFDITAAARRRLDVQIARHGERLSPYQPGWGTADGRPQVLVV